LNSHEYYGGVSQQDPCLVLFLILKQKMARLRAQEGR